MSIEDNKRVTRKFLELLHKQAIDDAFALLAPDATWWIPNDKAGGVTIPKDHMRPGVTAFVSIFAQQPDNEIGRMTAEEDRVSVEQTARNGRTRGGFTYANDYHLLFRLRDGLIVEVREYMNPLLGAGMMAEISAAISAASK